MPDEVVNYRELDGQAGRDQVIHPDRRQRKDDRQLQSEAGRANARELPEAPRAAGHVRGHAHRAFLDSGSV